MNKFIQDIKNRFGIVGTSKKLDNSIDIAYQVAKTDLTTLITGESGSGKDVFSKIIHSSSSRKHQGLIAVNCGSIPEGTVDSELFGHEKGAFTGAYEARKGYFEQIDKGVIFLDEIGELPLSTQARLLRVLESGEIIKVGSSKVQKVDVRIIAATNVDLMNAIRKNKFREDLYYRLNTVPITVPPLRERKEDIHLLFRKFVADFSHKYNAPLVRLNEKAIEILENYAWPGNIRQLKNIAQQIAVLEQHKDHMITGEIMSKYIPNAQNKNTLPIKLASNEAEPISERDLLYRVLFDMERDMSELKKLVATIIQQGQFNIHSQFSELKIQNPNPSTENFVQPRFVNPQNEERNTIIADKTFATNNKTFIETEEVENNLSLIEKEADLIKKALEKYNGKRKPAAEELGISERTLYRKIKNLQF